MMLHSPFWYPSSRAFSRNFANEHCSDFQRFRLLALQCSIALDILKHRRRIIRDVTLIGQHVHGEHGEHCHSDLTKLELEAVAK